MFVRKTSDETCHACHLSRSLSLCSFFAHFSGKNSCYQMFIWRNFSISILYCTTEHCTNVHQSINFAMKRIASHALPLKFYCKLEKRTLFLYKFDQRLNWHKFKWMYSAIDVTNAVLDFCFIHIFISTARLQALCKKTLHTVCHQFVVRISNYNRANDI